VPREARLTNPPAPVKVVAGILLDADDRVLIADRAGSTSMQDFWEFPGGKVDDGESNESALRRELAEELDIRITIAEHFHFLEHRYPDLQVAIDFYLVSGWDGEPSGQEGQQLKWVPRQSLSEQRLLPADAPVIELLAGGT
jgi:8-oxo-dGTP diphosphatase